MRLQLHWLQPTVVLDLQSRVGCHILNTSSYWVLCFHMYIPAQYCSLFMCLQVVCMVEVCSVIVGSCPIYNYLCTRLSGAWISHNLSSEYRANFLSHEIRIQQLSHFGTIMDIPHHHHVPHHILHCKPHYVTSLIVLSDSSKLALKMGLAADDRYRVLYRLFFSRILWDDHGAIESIITDIYCLYR